MFDAIFYNPIYNLLIGILGTVPLLDLGLAVIIVTLLVKFIILPFSLSASKTQHAMKSINPQVDAINEKYKGKKDRDSISKKGEELMALYRENSVNPFASIPILLIQIPIFLALYWIFYNAGLPDIQLDRLYAFTPIPEMISMQFLGFIDLTGRSLALAAIAGLAQFGFTKLAFVLPEFGGPSADGKPSMGQDFGKMLGTQMKYGLPIFIAVFSYFVPVIALYFIATNIFSIFQELFIKRRADRKLLEAEIQKEKA
jgi:YidC/Oxa1 family membrane protein insertase